MVIKHNFSSSRREITFPQARLHPGICDTEILSPITPLRVRRRLVVLLRGRGLGRSVGNFLA